MGSVKLVDPKIKDDILRYPTVQLIRKLFPERNFTGRSLICNPLREDRHPSLSCFRDGLGLMRWKDHATGDTGDNIDFYRKVYDGLSYVEAVDSLSILLFGKSALKEGEAVTSYSELLKRKTVRRVHIPAPEEPQKLVLGSSSPYVPGKTSEQKVSYVRGRGISDEVASAFLYDVTIENLRKKGCRVMDPESNQPLLDENGNYIMMDYIFDAVAIKNDLGAYSFRSMDTPSEPGVKRSTVPFISTFLAGGASPSAPVRFRGTRGEGYVAGFAYDPNTQYLSINQTQGFVGVRPEAVRVAAVFLDSWSGRFLEGRELAKCEAVLSSLNCPASREVDLVEGMFDGLSDIEFEHMAGHGAVPARDLVILNSLNNLNWAIPFLAVHGKVRCLLDNDMSLAGQNAFVKLQEKLSAFASRANLQCEIVNDSGIFYPYKDMNDFLVARKAELEKKAGMAAKAPVKKAVQKSRRAPVRDSKKIKIVKP